MAELGCYSPSFKKPSEVLRMRRKRARSEGPDRRTVDGLRPFSPGPLLNAPSRASGGGKRRNPFANIENTYSRPKKRALSHNDGYDGALDGRKTAAAVLDGKLGEERANAAASFREELFNTEQQHEIKTPVSLSEDAGLFEEGLFEPERSAAVLKGPEAVCDAAPAEVCLEFPADWSLKTRLLFTSSQSFSWAEHLKAQEEAQGLSSHCRAEFSSLPAHIQEPRGCVELRCGFHQCLQYWQHPSLPWLSLFPRIGAERKFSGKCVPWAQDTALQQSLMSDWSVSLTSLYRIEFSLPLLEETRKSSARRETEGEESVSSEHSENEEEEEEDDEDDDGGFSWLKEMGVQDKIKKPDAISIKLYPLQSASAVDACLCSGIEFSLPLLEETRKSRARRETEGEESVSSEHSENEEEEEEDEDDDDGGFSWLKEMGVQDKIKKPDAISIKLRKEHREVRLDHRPESVVLVEGSNTFTLLNFLINCKSLVAGAGSQAGLPPTLLAPTAFRGATLHTLKARAVNVKTRVRMGYQDVCSLEVTGPIMPHTLHALTQLLKPAQKGEFSVGLYTHEPTAVLNVPLSLTPEPQQLESVVRDLGRCGLQQSSIQQLVTPSMLGKSALRQLHMRDYSYSWKS
ncbi:protein downstream neighbor of son homolog [Sinocyclocheilus grahami]|uniref:protein downstream neighbor of son homolog n=1 Tax=Sinocyclocheilus grahami TaxID=75366 RepID=UPI0007AD49C5|nr:PREDICTED: protein downstream neighbor of son homolog [Sinocyclocheilus grahami]